MSAVGGAGEPVPPEDAELAAQLRAVLLVSSRILRTRTADDDVSASQFSVLAYLHRNGASTPGAIAAFEHVSPPVMTRMLGRLEKEGLVVRSAHPDDGRQVLASLTERGHEVVVQGRRERDAWLSTRIGDISEKERRTLREAAHILRRSFIGRPD
ncbi:MarR family winged helix-turn-helix transcriptional regulator [Brachybacterium sp. DNPG3]